MAEYSQTEITGEVESVVFHNEENGYTIMKLRPDGRGREPLTVVGCLPGVTPGEKVHATGRWTDDRQYGKQFRADTVQAETPQSRKGIERFLGSGLIDGIGKEYASRIVKKFGENVFDIIDHTSQRLEEIQGIGPKRRRQIKKSWQQQRAVREIMVFLHGNGISTARALRIFRTYGDESVDILRANPYRLASDIAGVGFKTADGIARKMGISADSPRRLAAGIEFVLGEASGRGHCALPRESLLEEAGETLGISEPAILDGVLSRLQKEEKVVEEQGLGGQRLIYLPDLFHAEAAVAGRIRRLASQPAGHPPIDPERALEWFEKKSGFEFGEEQRGAVTEALRNRFLIITGGPGVGKTTILNAVLEILAAKKVTPVLCAPTGRAAKRLSESTGRDAGTIHRLLETRPDGGFVHNRAKPLEGDLFVADEASMIDIRLMHSLLDAIPDDGHVLLVGDVDQLPPVGPGTVLRDLIDSGAVPVSRLTRIFRQAEASRIITTAHAINAGRMPDLETASGSDSDFFFIERGDPQSILDTLVEVVGNRLPARYGYDPLRDIQVLTPMNRDSLGTVNLNKLLQQALNPPAELKFEIERFGVTFRTGDKVIQTRNNYDHEVFNGDIGVIAEITTEPVKIRVVFDKLRQVEYEPGELDELQPAYAITIHKSQGSEFPAIVIPVSTRHYIMLQRNLIYTGITRGKRLVVLIGEPRALAMAVKNQESRRRFAGLRARLDQTV